MLRKEWTAAIAIYNTESAKLKIQITKLNMDQIKLDKSRVTA